MKEGQRLRVFLLPFATVESRQVRESEESVDPFLIQQLPFAFSFELREKFPQEVLTELDGVVFAEMQLRKQIQGLVGNLLIFSENHLVEFGHQLKLSPLTHP